MLSRNHNEVSHRALLAELWVEMEAIVGLHYTEDAFGPGAPERVGLRVEALLLEIDLLRVRCKWMQEQGRLAAEQADRLWAMLAELEELLDDEPLENPLIRTSATIVRAQNRLLDELRKAGVNRGIEVRDAIEENAARDDAIRGGNAAGRFTVNSSSYAVPAYERLRFRCAGPVQQPKGVWFQPIESTGS